MANITESVTAQTAPVLQSFGAGGQMYIADIWGGFNISAKTDNPLFNFRATDLSMPNAEQLTNLVEASKIGSTMEFKAVQLGLRVIPLTSGAVLDPAVVEDMKSLLASAVVTITYGSNNTRIGEFSGLHLMAPVDYVAADATNNCAAQNGAINNTSWINLPVPVCIQANLNIGGTVRFTRPVPASLYATDNSFGFVVIMSGLKVVKS